MSRKMFHIVAMLACTILASCESPETSARAETVAPEPVPSHVAPPPDAEATPALDQSEVQSSSPPRSPDALSRLKAQLTEIAEEPADDPPPVIPAPAPDTIAPPPPAAEPDEIETLRGDVKDLRREVARLQETVDAALAYLVGELGDENRRLKTDIASQEEIAQGGDRVTAAPIDPEVPAAPVVARIDYGKDGYLALKEWGRTPEQAKELGGDVSSLRGMICAVTPGVSDEELKAIGKKLRGTCAGYDNINIDVFDDEAAARDYVDRNVRSSEHFVMNITRHKASGQDVTVLVRENGAREVVVE